MLTTLDIIKLLSAQKDFNGVYPIDCLPITCNVPYSIIVNLDPHYKDGSHWVALTINENRQGHYFDSFGRPPTGNILTFLEKNASRGYIYNKIKYQGNNSTACGYFCIFFILMSKKLALFYKCLRSCSHLENEIIILMFLKRVFSYKVSISKT